MTEDNDDDHEPKHDFDEHPPDEDIDQYVENVNFRIERMSEESVWVAAYPNNDDTEVEHHYDIWCDDGLHIRHRREPSRD